MPSKAKPDRPPDAKKCRADYVVHPLDDLPERKRDPAKVGPMKMTPTVKAALIALRVYLILILLLVIWRVIEVAGGWRVH